MRTEPPPPTLEQFAAYQRAWGYFNQALFGGELQPCLLNFSRHRGSRGFFTANRWQKGEQMIHEISLNPDLLRRSPDQSLSTLVHEMVHQWQQDHGTPPRRCYHDLEWANKMQETGLIPSDTGEQGGKRTGQSVSHYIDPDGRFIKAFNKMPADCLLPWASGTDMDPTPKPKAPRKVRLLIRRLPVSGYGRARLPPSRGRKARREPRPPGL
jgi:SprT-like family